eukprot:759670-Hanusia_phi.AAC.1
MATQAWAAHCEPARTERSRYGGHGFMASKSSRCCGSRPRQSHYGRRGTTFRSSMGSTRQSTIPTATGECSWGRGGLVNGCCRYRGQYEGNMKSGQGTLLFKNGDKYEGEFQQDMQVIRSRSLLPSPSLPLIFSPCLLLLPIWLRNALDQREGEVDPPVSWKFLARQTAWACASRLATVTRLMWSRVSLRTRTEGSTTESENAAAAAAAAAVFTQRRQMAERQTTRRGPHEVH